MARPHIACSYDGAIQEDSYAANVAPGRGAGLLAILGFESIPDKKTIVLLERGKETTTLPGNRPCNVCLGEDAKIMTMEKTMSGHLGIPCGEWGARQRADVVAGRATGPSNS